MNVNKILLLAVMRRRRQKRKINRKFWVHPVISSRKTTGFFYTRYVNLRMYPDKFMETFRMSVASFDELLKIIKNDLRRQDTNMRESITPEHRLCITLSFLADGTSFRRLYIIYQVGRQTISESILMTCEVIWNRLQPLEMALPNEQDYRTISENFYSKTGFPNCVGAVDGKHVRMRNPKNKGSEFFNFKHYFSTILMAIVDADYCFLMIDVGSYGSKSDSGVFKDSNFGTALYTTRTLPLPAPQKLPNDEDGREMPFVFVGDEAFAIDRNLLRPYPGKHMTNTQRIFNYRLSRARRMVECAFGILTNKFGIFHTSIRLDENFTDKIIKACCVLHNFIRRRDGYDQLHTSSPSRFFIDRKLKSPKGSMSGGEVRDYFANWCVNKVSVPCS